MRLRSKQVQREAVTLIPREVKSNVSATMHAIACTHPGCCRGVSSRAVFCGCRGLGGGARSPNVCMGSRRQESHLPCYGSPHEMPRWQLAPTGSSANKTQPINRLNSRSPKAVSTCGQSGFNGDKRCTKRKRLGTVGVRIGRLSGQFLYDDGIWPCYP